MCVLLVQYMGHYTDPKKERDDYMKHMRLPKFDASTYNFVFNFSRKIYACQT